MPTVLLVFLCVTGILLLAGVFAGLYFYDLALNVKTDKEAALVALPPGAARITMEQGPRFLDTVEHADFYRSSYDGLKLHAIAVEQNPTYWVLIAHGYTSAARGMGNIARAFYGMGYSLFLPDARGHGQSEGDYIGMGWKDRKDVLMWIDVILSAHPDAKILLYGVSMGGATVMMASGETLPPQVKGVIEDCGFSSIYGEMRHQLINIFHYPGFIADYILFFADIVTRLRAGYSLHDGDVCAQLRHARLPMLFLHGEADHYIPCAMMDAVYAAAATKDKRKVLIPNAPHSGAAVTNPERYWKEIGAFVKRVMPVRS